MLTRDEDVLAAAESWREAGRDVAIATVVETWARPRARLVRISSSTLRGIFSAPYPAGASRARSWRRAADVIANGAPRMLEFGVADEDRMARRALLRRPYQGLCREARLMRLDVLKAMNAARNERRAGAIVTPSFRRRPALRSRRSRRRRSSRRGIGGGAADG